MQYVRLDTTEREALLDALRSMPAYLRATFSALSAEQARAGGPDGAFSPVEQVWHLADLEREGFAVRIDRLRRGANPQLPDFDGTAAAAARNYRSLSLAEGLQAFESAREQPLRAALDPLSRRLGAKRHAGRRRHGVPLRHPCFHGPARYRASRGDRGMEDPVLALRNQR